MKEKKLISFHLVPALCMERVRLYDSEFIIVVGLKLCYHFIAASDIEVFLTVTDFSQFMLSLRVN